MKDLFAIIVQDKSAVLKSKSMTYTHKIWGKSIFEWVLTSLGSIPSESVEIESRSELLSAIKNNSSDSKYTIVLFAETPLLKNATVCDIYNSILQSDKKAIRLTNGYIFETAYMLSLTDLNNLPYSTYDEEDFLTASSYRQLSLISDILKTRILEYHMDNGVYIVDPQTTYIDCDTTIGRGCTIYPNNLLQGACKIESDVILKANNMLKNATIQSGAVIWASTVEDSCIGQQTAVGPYAYIRNGSQIGNNCKVGDYVEIKNSKIGNGSKMSHLTYVGDAEIGEKCNLGCGVIFVNYDGKTKSQTIVGDKVFIGSNSNLIAPVKIESGAFIAAGTTVTENVDAGKLVIGRVRQAQKDYKSNYLADEK